MDTRGQSMPSDRRFAEQFRRKAAGATPPQPTTTPAADQPLRIDETFLAEVGLEELPPELQQELLRQVIETLQERTGTRIAAAMTDTQLAEFERLSESGDESAVLTWLKTNAPDFKAITRQTFLELKDELRANAAAILAAAQDDSHDS
jgi:hypothetical protein